MTADPVSPVLQHNNSTGHAGEDAQEEDAESDWDPEEPLFDGDGEDLSQGWIRRSGTRWSRMPRRKQSREMVEMRDRRKLMHREKLRGSRTMAGG